MAERRDRGTIAAPRSRAPHLGVASPTMLRSSALVPAMAAACFAIALPAQKADDPTSRALADFYAGPAFRAASADG